MEFEREHKDEIKHEDAEVDAAKGAGDTIIFYDYPGSERKVFDVSLGAFGSDKITVDTTYTDGEGRRWGFIGYWYGYRNLWISLDDPTVEVPPAAEQPAPVSTGAPAYLPPKGGGAPMIIGGGLAALAALIAVGLIKGRKKKQQ